MSTTPEEVTGELETPRRNIVPPPPGPGRPKGVPNKITTAMRNTAHYIVESRAEEFIEWLDSIAKTKPEKACSIYIRLIETYSAKPQGPSFEIAAATHTNPLGESVTALRLRALLEGPEA